MLAVALLALVLLMAALTRGRFIDPANLRDIIVNTSIPVVVAAGMTALIVAAQIDISVGAIVAVAAVIVALLAEKGVPLPLLVLAGTAAGALLGSVNGGLTAGLRIPSIVATLATLGAIRGLLVLVTHGNSIPVPPGLTAIGAAGLGPTDLTQGWILVLAAAAVCAAMSVYLGRTRAGRRQYAVGSNPRSAELSGVPVGWVTFRSFVLLGALAGVAGFLFVCRYTPIYPTPTRGFELEVITAVVVGGTDIFGGRGTIAGTCLAALLLSTIATSLAFLRSYMKEAFGFDLPSEAQPAVQGLLILAAVLYNSLSRRAE
ncbi:MAG TPA: ABC transporter permease [Armatimonadota bacterium]|nr:ABC transporter permease [Armatimonadota bacterium]